MGLSLVAEDKENAAADGILLVLGQRRGFRDDDKELDAMGIQLKYFTPNSDSIRASESIQHVLAPFRHRPPVDVHLHNISVLSLYSSCPKRSKHA